MEGELRISKARVFQMVGAAAAKLQEPKHVQTRGTESKLCQTNANYEMERFMRGC